MMLRTFLLIVSVLFPLFINAQSYQPKDILRGRWTSNNTAGGQLKFFEKEGKFFAKLILPSKDKKDKNTITIIGRKAFISKLQE